MYSILSDKYDVTYFIEPEVTEYTLDRNKEYTQVLASNDTINVYGDTLLQSGNESIITAKNESVVAKVTSQDIKKISYSDYGQTSDIKSGNGYNSETLDQTGLIYLRARYYDPSVSRFVQIDNNYDGEKQSVASQNKYVYTMNNPYKYVDRNGNWSLWGAITNVVKKVVNTVVKVVTKVAKTVVNTVVGFFSPSTAKNINKAIDNVSKKVTSFVDGIGGNSSNKGGGSQSVKPAFKNVDVEAKCPEKERSGWDKFWDGVVDAGKSAWNGVKDFGSAVWGKICDAGAFVAKKGKEFLSWIDAGLDTVAKAGSVIVFVAGVIAVAATVAAALPALAGVTILGASIGAIGSVAGTFALYGGAAMMAVDGTQIISGHSGYRLDGSKLTKAQAQARIQNGQTNMMLAYSGGMMGGTSLQVGNSNSQPSKNEGASGAGSVKIEGRGNTGRTVANDVLEQTAMKDALKNPFEHIQGSREVSIVKDSLSDSRWLGWEKWQIVYRTNEGRNITIHFNYDSINGLFDDFKFK